MNNTLTAVKGIKVGHYTDNDAVTGCTVVLTEQGAVCGVDVRGAAPGTRETDLLRGDNLVECVHAIVLSGGSAFGLSSAGGVMRYLEQNGIGLDTGFAKVPIVPAAVIYDLGIGRSDIRPGEEQGYAACLNATAKAVPTGNVGCGAGATVGKLLGGEFAGRGGIGSSAIKLADGVIVAALIVVNSLGDIYENGEIIAGANKQGAFLNCQKTLLNAAAPAANQNTTIGVVATNAKLTREEANRLATVAHDGLAISIRPVHTQYDGDTLFALSTSQLLCQNKVALHAAVVEAVQRAIVDAVKPGV